MFIHSILEIVKEIVVEHKPKKDHTSDDEEEEDRSASSDDESVVHIDDPDPLAMLYMTIHGHINSKRNQDSSSSMFIQGQLSSSVVSLKNLIYGNSSCSSSVLNTGRRQTVTNCEVIDLQSDEDERMVHASGYDSDCLIVDVDTNSKSIVPEVLPATDDNADTDVMIRDPLLPLDAHGLPISLTEQRQKQLKGVAINRTRFVPCLIKATHATKLVAPTVIDAVAAPTGHTTNLSDQGYTVIISKETSDQSLPTLSVEANVD